MSRNLQRLAFYVSAMVIAGALLIFLRNWLKRRAERAMEFLKVRDAERIRLAWKDEHEPPDVAPGKSPISLGGTKRKALSAPAGLLSGAAPSA